RMEDRPGYELWELEQFYRQDGVAAGDAKEVTAILARYPRAYARSMVAHELGLPLEPDTARVPEALTMGLSYIVGSIFPLIAYFFLPVAQAIPASLALTFVALVLVGLIKGRLTSLNLFRSVIEIVIVGTVSAGGGYVLGDLVPRWLGLA
ncbi:MAG: VIT1/CCC1 transporter family protein, partial [Chloroflexi bacterium]|nr:VIT1/CCC1 transporter family protein [Chloroflexota bacterium]